MVAIINISSPPTKRGPNKYVLKINNKMIVEFTHYREESLSTLLRRAAAAYDFRGGEVHGTFL